MIGRVILGKALAANGVLTKVPVRTIYPHQSSNTIATMPRNRIAFMEKVSAGVMIAFMILATPAWVVTHMDDYRSLEKE